MGPGDDSRSDEDLVATCNRGTAGAAAAFNALYARHRNYVLRIALRFTDDREIAADALQDVFTYLLKQFPPPGSGLTLTARLTTYLYPITRNTTLTLLRQKNRIPSASVEPDTLESDNTSRSDADDIDRLLAALPAEKREILTLRFVDEMSLQEVSAALDIPLGTAKSRLHHAIKALREHPAAKNFFGG